MPVLPNGQKLPYTKSGQTSPGYQGPYLQSMHLGPDGRLYPWMPPPQPGESGGQLGMQAPNIPRVAGVALSPGAYVMSTGNTSHAIDGAGNPITAQTSLGQSQPSNIPRAAGVGGAPGPMAGMQMGHGGILTGNPNFADMETRRRAAMMGQGFGMPVWRAPARMTGNPMGMPAPAAGATMQRQIPAGMVPQVQAYAAQRTQQPGAQRLTGMQQGMTSGMPSQNLQGVQTGAQDYVTNRGRGILGGAL